MFSLSFEKRVGGTKLQKADFMPLFRYGLKILQQKGQLKNVQDGSEVHLAIVNDEEIKALNLAYRGKNSSTDVLSFSYLQEKSFPLDNLIGELVISVETAMRQACARKKTFKEEARFLFVHGLLHLFGHDHKKPAERKKMFALQDEILGNPDGTSLKNFI